MTDFESLLQALHTDRCSYTVAFAPQQNEVYYEQDSYTARVIFTPEGKRIGIDMSKNAFMSGCVL